MSYSERHCVPRTHERDMRDHPNQRERRSSRERGGERPDTDHATDEMAETRERREACVTPPLHTYSSTQVRTANAHSDPQGSARLRPVCVRW